MAARTIGRYVVGEEIGQGGMATVYRATDPATGGDVALKVLALPFLHDPKFRARFEREARIVAGLQHPAIVPVEDYGEEDGQPYLVMPLLTGGSLEDRLRPGPLPLADAVAITRRLAAALDAAHAHGVIHRDLKPANVLFDAASEPYLTDFGIVKLLDRDALSLTTAGGIIGTPAYMSPEQVQGSPLDGRSDLYALGVILFQMLTGRLPFDAPTPISLALKHLNEPVPDLTAPDAAAWPAGLQAVVKRALAKRPEDRYPTGEALVHDLEALLAGGGPQPTVVLPGAAETRSDQAVETGRGRSFPRRLAVLAAVLLVLGAAGGLLLARGGGSELPATTAAAGALVATPEPSPTVTPAPASTSAPAVGPPTQAPSPTSRPTVAVLKTAVTPPTPATRQVLARVEAAVEVRAGPGEAYPEIGTVEQGDEVVVVGRTADGEWFNVALSDRRRAWLPAAALAADAALIAVPPVETVPARPSTATATPQRPTRPPSTATPTATQPPPAPTAPPEPPTQAPTREPEPTATEARPTPVPLDTPTLVP